MKKVLRHSRGKKRKKNPINALASVIYSTALSPKQTELHILSNVSRNSVRAARMAGKQITRLASNVLWCSVHRQNYFAQSGRRGGGKRGGPGRWGRLRERARNREETAAGRRCGAPWEPVDGGAGGAPAEQTQPETRGRRDWRRRVRAGETGGVRRELVREETY
jgi:hypothetical protein